MLKVSSYEFTTNIVVIETLQITNIHTDFKKSH